MILAEKTWGHDNFGAMGANQAKMDKNRVENRGNGGTGGGGGDRGKEWQGS